MMRPNKTATLFMAVLLPAAFLTGLAAHQFPQLTQGGFPAYSWPLIIAFLVEASLRPRIDRGALPPLTMPWRFIGVIAGAIITVGTTAYLDGTLDFAALISGF